MSADDGKKQNLAQDVSITPLQHIISACTGAVLTSLMMTPFDVIKIRLQSQAKPSAFTNGHCFLYCNGLMDHLCHCCGNQTSSVQWFKRPGHFSGTFDALVKIVRYEGVTSLWSGLPPTLVMAVPATVVYFTSYEHLKTRLHYQEGNTNDYWKPLVAGSTARLWAASLISPIEMVRTKMQSEKLKYSQIRTAVRDTVRNNGVLSLWRGLGPTLLRDVPFSGADKTCVELMWREQLQLIPGLEMGVIQVNGFKCSESAMYWTSYETFKRYILTKTGHSSLSFHESFGAGAFAGSISAVLTLPFDVIKTRRQIELGEQLIGRQEPISTWKIIAKIYSNEGFKALFTGLPPRLLKVAPACAIMISSFEYFKHFFAVRQQSTELDSNNQ